MSDQAQVLFLEEVFPSAGSEQMRLLQGAAENGMLLATDFYTVRDWLDMADCRGSEEAHAALLVMMAALDEGSLCVELSEATLTRRLRDFVGDEDATRWARRIETTLANGLPALIGVSPGDARPVILHGENGRRFLYFQKYLRAELDFRAGLSARLDEPAPAPAAPWPGIVREVLSSQSLKPDREQQIALGAALLNNLTIISGGPGTGKTSIVLTLLRCLIRNGIEPERIALAAPTGRAAQRLTDAVRFGLANLANDTDERLRHLSATTLHHLLGYWPSRNIFTRHCENPIDADVVIVDETSMVGLVLVAQLFQALAPRARLVLLGDKDQLPSIDAGGVLATLTPESGAGFTRDWAERLRAIFPELSIDARPASGPLANRVVVLETNHRSQEAIRAAGRAINRQEVDLVDRLLAIDLAAPFEAQPGCRFLDQALGTPQELRGFLNRWIDEAYFQARAPDRTLADWLDDFEKQVDPAPPAPQIFDLLDRFRLLTMVRDGPWGCEEINRYVEIRLRPRLDRDARSPLFTGAPVLITRNDAERGLLNGDVGIALRLRSGALRVYFRRQESCVSIPSDALPAHELGFALTVHKSQGSEYQNVMVVLPPNGGRRLLTKELLYTAITRAKSLAVICSTKEALRFAIGRKVVRESGLLNFSQ